MKKLISFVVMVILLVVGLNNLEANQYADSVISYTSGSGVGSPHNNPSNALGAPDVAGIQGGGWVSLGDGGILIVAFTDNSITTSGDSRRDLWIYEIQFGIEGEGTSVAISTDGSNWVEVGQTSGTVAGFDIDACIGSGVELGERYSYVRITDLAQHQSSPPMAGADIDAIEAITSADPVNSTTTTSSNTTTTTSSTTTSPDCGENEIVCGSVCCDVFDEECCNNSHCCFRGTQCCGAYCCTPPNWECFADSVCVFSFCLSTEIYGENSDEVKLMRAFRDEVLSKSPLGQEIIELYYEWSPVIVEAMEEDEEFKQEVKEMIDGILPLIRETLE